VRYRWVGFGCALALGVFAAEAAAAPTAGELKRVLDVMSPARANGGTPGQVGVLVREVSATNSSVRATPVLAAGETVPYEPASSIKTILGVVAERSVSPSSTKANPAVVVYSYPDSPNAGTTPDSMRELCPVALDETVLNQRSGVTLQQAQSDMLELSDNVMTRALLLRAGGWDAALGLVRGSVAMPNTVLRQDFLGCGQSLGRSNRTTLTDMSTLYAAIDSPPAGLLDQTRRDDLYSTMPYGYANGKGAFPDVAAEEARKLQLTRPEWITFNNHSFSAFKSGSYRQPCLADVFWDLPSACLVAAPDQRQIDVSLSGLQRLGFVLPNGGIDTRTYTFGAYIVGRVCPAGECYDAAGAQLAVAIQGEAFRALIRDSMLSIKYPQDAAPTAAFTAGEAVAGTVRFDASGSSDRDGGVAAYTWDFGDGSTGTGPTPSHSYGAPGSYAVELGVADCEGKSDTIRRSVAVGTTAAAARASSADRTPPQLRVKLAGKPRRCGSASVRATLDSPARLKVVITRTVTGRRVKLSTISRPAGKGATTIALGRLVSGRYTVKVTATDAAGNVSAPRTLRLTV
jgi:hypothetical protein